MYRTKRIEVFMDKVHKEADAAAQKVYDKYTPELLRRIQSQLHPDDELHIGMGSASISRKGKDYFVADALSSICARTQYCEELSANFLLPTYIYKDQTK